MIIQYIARYAGFIILFCLAISQLMVIWNWKKIALPLRYFGYFLFWNFLIEIAARIMQYSEVNNLPLLHIYTLGEFLLFSLFYSKLKPFNSWPGKRFMAFVVIISLLIVCNSIFLQPVHGYNSYAKAVVQIAIIGYAILFFYFDATALTEPSAAKSGIRILNGAVLTYYSGSLFIFMFSDVLENAGMDLPNGFWLFNVLLNLVFQILVLIAIWRATSENRRSLF